MLMHIQAVLTPEEAAQYRRALVAADWVDGRVTAGYQSSRTKHNLQLAEDHPLAMELSDQIVQRLERHPLFMGAALPLKVFPPLFNRYEGGHSFGTHVDNAIRQVKGTPHRLRTDLSATLFLTEPSDYEGGELIIEDTYGTQSVKLPAGDMILYPATSLHHVLPVTRGARISSFFWIQSMVRDDARRALLFDLDVAIQRLAGEAPDHPSAVQLTGVYHNLIRMWADV
ncbi:Fe2+-dependent dioxygenase [Bryobacter aggregatus]|uniref:Fe2+-dependent dioxygenase n=1 Tax=Bryobacter aggregatus TaxID=360054 RepID=UPI0004E10D1E